MRYINFYYRHGLPEEAVRFDNIELALNAVTRLIPAIERHDFKMSLFGEVEIDETGIAQIGIHPGKWPRKFGERFSNPSDIHTILVQREDVVSAGERERLIEGNKPTTIVDAPST
jgi:hypothetical protein